MKNRILKSVAIALCSMALVACSSTKSAKGNQSESSGELSSEMLKKEFLSFKKTSCLGKCPVYEFKILNNKSCSVNGELFFVVEGEHEGNITQAQYDEIVQKVKAIDYFNLSDFYDNPLVQDIPATYITVNMGEKTKSIKSRYKSPQELRDFLTYLDELAKSIQWKKKVQK